MPSKRTADRKRYLQEYTMTRYHTDQNYREHKRKKAQEWREKQRDYSEYIAAYRLKRRQYALWLKYRTEWKARRNLKTYLDILQALKNSEHYKKSHRELGFSEQ